MKFSELAETYERILGAGSEPRRVEILADTLERARGRTLSAVAHFTVGEVVLPQLSERLGIGAATIRAALVAATGKSEAEIDDEVKQTGDMSAVVEREARGRDALTVERLWQSLHQAVEQEKERLRVVEEVFAHTNALGAKYFTRMVLKQMRIGVGFGTMTSAIARAFQVERGAVERLYTLTNDIGLAATEARRGARALGRAGLTLFRPYQFMNAHKMDDPAEIFRRLHGKRIIFEVKYDGARLQIHIGGGESREVRLFSRRLNDDTAAMPDLVRALQKAWRGGEAIIEGEAVAFDPKLETKLPFQSVLMRLGRVHNIEEKACEIPLVLHLFDLVYHDGEDLMQLGQRERRERLVRLFRPTTRVRLTDSIETDSPAEEEAFFRRALREGHEGVMAKDPDAIYLPGRRAENWMKIKPAFETLDVVVTGGIYGSGRRRGLLSSLVVAIRDRDTYKTVGKVGTGFSEETLRDLTSRLESQIITARGRDVELEPSMVIEVDFQDIQKSSRYPAGYVLRIPRFKRERTDKSTREADTLERLKRLYKQTH